MATVATSKSPVRLGSFASSDFKDGILRPCADRLGRAACKLQALFQGPLAKLLAQDMFSEFLWYKLDWINPNHVNLSFLNFQLNLSMGCYDRASGTGPSSACWAPLWSSSSWQAYAWPTTFTGHVPNLGWLTGLVAVQLLSNSIVCIELTKQIHSNNCMENSCHLPPTGFFSARGWISDLLYRPCHGAGHRGRFGWVPLVQCWLSVSWFLMPWRFHVETTLLASIA